jgi:hypothetical protein
LEDSRNILLGTNIGSSIVWQHPQFLDKIPTYHVPKIENSLIPKGQSPFFGPFLEFGQAIVDAIFVQKSQIFGEHVV